MTIWGMRQALDDGDADALARHVPEGFEKDPVTTALMLVGATAHVTSLREVALCALGAELQRVPPLTLRALDQAFRSTRLTRFHRVEMNRRTHHDLVEPRAMPDGGPILASLSRDGYLRADAVDTLGRTFGLGTMNALLVRTSDPVGPVRSAAIDYVRGALKRANTPGQEHDDERMQFAFALPLVEQMAHWSRTSSIGLPAAIGTMLSTTDGGRAALAKAVQSEDAATRQAALRVSLDAGVPGHAQMLAILGAALMDDSPRIRLSAARRILAEESLAKIFFERLHVDKSPHIRTLTIRSRAKFALESANDDGAHEALQRATFDHNANVRFWARRLVLKFGSPLDYRGRSQAILGASRPNQSKASGPSVVRLEDIVGALATLSEFGRSEDIGLVEPFCGHERRRVRREAARTLEILLRL